MFILALSMVSDVGEYKKMYLVSMSWNLGQMYCVNVVKFCLLQ